MTDSHTRRIGSRGPVNPELFTDLAEIELEDERPPLPRALLMPHHRSGTAFG